MAKRITTACDEATRKKIQTTQLIKRLNSHAFGEVQLENSQVKAIQILLAKSLPDLSTVTIQGDPDKPQQHNHTITLVKPKSA